MDIEKRARRQSRRVIISEILMVVTVIITVSILAFIVSGYWVGSDFKIERQGLLQIYSTPTAADIEVDGGSTSWLQRTNTSKTLAAGEHNIKLTKEGYDSWSRTVNITEGLLYRLHYPRLFLKDRTVETALDVTASSATVTPDRNLMLLMDNTTTWQLLNLDTEKIEPTKLDLANILPFTSQAEGSKVGLFNGIITQIDWASDNEHVLLKTQHENDVNWVLINVKKPESSINLSKEFNAKFTDIKIQDQSASNLLAILDNNLHRVDVSAKQISAVLVSKINSFDYFNQDVVFSAQKDEGYYVGLLKLSSGDIKELATVSSPAKVIITKFYDDEYVGVIEDSKITLHLKNDFVEKNNFTLSFIPSKVKIGTSGEAIIMYNGGQIASLDMEATELLEWNTGTDSFGWLDDNMIYAVKDNILNVYDFNGLNHRTLSNNISAHFPVTITSDKYLYYFRDGSLIREYLFEK